METEIRLIQLLADGERHSGAALAAELGISRAAVCKAVARASQKLGLDILAVKGQGYRLTAPLELLDPRDIQARLSSAVREHAGPIHCFDQIDSTNAWLLEQSTQGAASGTCVLAERQTAGRGRRGRVWHSPFGSNLYLSMLWRFDAGPAALGPLSLAAGTAVAQALQYLGVSGVQLKWPNDIHWQARKLGGLLIEVAGETHGPSQAVLGLGLNIRMPDGAKDRIDQPWVDLRQACNGHPDDQTAPTGPSPSAQHQGVRAHPDPRRLAPSTGMNQGRDRAQRHSPSRNAVAAACIEQLTAMLTSFLRQGPGPFIAAWRQFDAYRDQPATLQWSEHEIRGIYRGIDDQGALLLQTASETRRFVAGEVSFRPAARPGLNDT